MNKKKDEPKTIFINSNNDPEDCGSVYSVYDKEDAKIPYIELGEDLFFKISDVFDHMNEAINKFREEHPEAEQILVQNYNFNLIGTRRESDEEFRKRTEREQRKTKKKEEALLSDKEVLLERVSRIDAQLKKYEEGK